MSSRIDGCDRSREQTKKQFEAVAMELKECNSFVEKYHRHHKPVYRDKFRLGAMVNGKIVGVAQVARPVNRNLDDGKTVEVVRCCTDGTSNCCSFLYSRCARASQALGYEKIITYILQSEDGASLKASGWHLEVDGCGGYSWDTPARRRTGTGYPTEKKQRWAKDLK